MWEEEAGGGGGGRLFKGEEGGNFLVELFQYVDKCEKLLDKDINLAKELERKHNKKYWTYFTEELKRRYPNDEEIRDALKILEDFDDVKVRDDLGFPIMTLFWRHNWKKDECVKKTLTEWRSTYGGKSSKAKGEHVVVRDVDGNEIVDYPTGDYCMRAFPSKQ